VVAFTFSVAISAVALPTATHLAGAASVPPQCALSALHFTLESNGGLGHGAFRVLVHNRGPSTRTLAGYSRVRVPLEDYRDQAIQSSLQRVMTPGSVAAIKDSFNSYAGGYLGPSSKSTTVRPPMVELPSRTGVASFNLVWIEIGPKPCPVSRVFQIGLAGAARFTSTHVMAFVCSSVDVTPFVNGVSGSWGMSQ
jgi:hypothetical protein